MKLSAVDGAGQETPELSCVQVSIDPGRRAIGVPAREVHQDAVRRAREEIDRRS